jgi:hypothetical protein
MGNSKGPHHGQELDGSLRQAAAVSTQGTTDAAFCWAPQPFLTRWRNGLPGYGTGKDIAKTITATDKGALAKQRK